MPELMQKLVLVQETLPRAWLFLFLFFLVVSVQYWFTGKFGPKRQRLPPSPPALPIIGHLHLIGSLPHVSLRGLTRKYGPDVMLLRLGAVPNLVVSSSRAAEAVLRTHDHVFASRPHSVISDTIMYGSSDIGFAPYGEYWRQARKLVTTHMLSVKKVQSFRGAAVEEKQNIGKGNAFYHTCDRRHSPDWSRDFDTLHISRLDCFQIHLPFSNEAAYLATPK